MNIYVVRWLNRIDNVEDCGNFEVCYSTEEEARMALLQDFENTKSEWKSSMDADDKFSENLKDDYAFICMQDECGKFDYHDWWIDKLELKVS